MAEENNSNGNSDSELVSISKLLILLDKGKKLLCHGLVEKFESLSGKKWEDSIRNRTNLIIRGARKEIFENGVEPEWIFQNISEWDISLLYGCVRHLHGDVPYEVLDELVLIRSELQGLDIPKISNKKFNEYWERITNLLVKLDVSQEEIDLVKSSPIVDLNKSSMLDPEIVLLKDLGNEAFKQDQFLKSIECYTNAIHMLEDTEEKEKGKIFSNRSVAFFKLKNYSCAKEDAKKTIELLPTWWKGYYRLGMAYKVKGKYEKAYHYLLSAQECDESPKHLDDEISLCKSLINQEVEIDLD